MVLFLDIDGVLHPFPLAIDDEQFSAIDRLWVLLERLPTVHVVITSTWRERHSFDELVQMLTKHGGVKFKERFVGITPVLEPPNEYVPGIRQREIEAWLHANDPGWACRPGERHTKRISACRGRQYDAAYQPG